MSDYSTSTTPEETQYQENTPTVHPRNRGCRHRRGPDRHEPCRGIGRELPKRIIWTSSCSGRNQLHRGRGTARHRRSQGQAPARSRSPVRFHACRGKGLRWPYLGRSRLSRGHEGWIAYCADNFAAEKIRATGQQRTDLITGFTPGKISNRGIAALLASIHQPLIVQKLKLALLPQKARSVTRQANSVT